MKTGRPMRANTGKGKEIWEYLRAELGIPEWTRKAVITISMDDVIRVEVDYMPVTEVETEKA